MREEASSSRLVSRACVILKTAVVVSNCVIYFRAVDTMKEYDKIKEIQQRYEKKEEATEGLTLLHAGQRRGVNRIQYKSGQLGMFATPSTL